MKDSRPREIRWLINDRATSRLQKEWENLAMSAWALEHSQRRKASSKESANNMRGHTIRAKPRITKTEFEGESKWYGQVWDKFHRESSSWVGGWRVEGVSLGRDQKGKHYRQRDSLSHEISLGAGGSIAWTQKVIGTPVRKMGQYPSIKTWWSHWTLGLNPEVSWGYWKFLNKKQ